MQVYFSNSSGHSTSCHKTLDAEDADASATFINKHEMRFKIVFMIIPPYSSNLLLYPIAVISMTAIANVSHVYLAFNIYAVISHYLDDKHGYVTIRHI